MPGANGCYSSRGGLAWRRRIRRPQGRTRVRAWVRRLQIVDRNCEHSSIVRLRPLREPLFFYPVDGRKSFPERDMTFPDTGWPRVARLTAGFETDMTEGLSRVSA